jgi:hypothetical protein
VEAVRAPREEAAARAPAAAEKEPAAEREPAVTERGPAKVEREVTAREVTAGPPATRGAEALVSILLNRAAALEAAALGGAVIQSPAISLESLMTINVVALTSRRKTNSKRAFQEKACHP